MVAGFGHLSVYLLQTRAMLLAVCHTRLRLAYTSSTCICKHASATLHPLCQAGLIHQSNDSWCKSVPSPTSGMPGSEHSRGMKSCWLPRTPGFHTHTVHLTKLQPGCRRRPHQCVWLPLLTQAAGELTVVHCVFIWDYLTRAPADRRKGGRPHCGCWLQGSCSAGRPLYTSRAVSFLNKSLSCKTLLKPSMACHTDHRQTSPHCCKRSTSHVAIHTVVHDCLIPTTHSTLDSLKMPAAVTWCRWQGAATTAATTKAPPWNTNASLTVLLLVHAAHLSAALWAPVLQSQQYTGICTPHCCTRCPGSQTADLQSPSHSSCHTTISFPANCCCSHTVPAFGVLPGLGGWRRAAAASSSAQCVASAQT
jgi:hypothetical protein